MGLKVPAVSDSKTRDGSSIGRAAGPLPRLCERLGSSDQRTCVFGSTPTHRGFNKHGVARLRSSGLPTIDEGGLGNPRAIRFTCTEQTHALNYPRQRGPWQCFALLIV